MSHKNYTIQDIKSDYITLSKQGHTIIPMFIGQPCVQTFGTCVKDFSYSPEDLCYGHTGGHINLKQKIAQTYGSSVDLEMINLHYGASDAIQKVLWAIFNNMNAGKRLLVHAPFYAYYKSMATSMSIDLIEWSFVDNDTTSLEKIIIENNIGAVIFSHPNNPTGHIYQETVLHEHIILYKKHNIFVISDEVYRGFSYKEKYYISCSSFFTEYQNIIVIDSFSKRYNICGARIGYSIIHDTQIRKQIKLSQYNEISFNGVSEKIAMECLSNGEAYLYNLNNQYKDIVMTVFNNSYTGREIIIPDSGLYFFIKTDLENTTDFIYRLLHEGVGLYGDTLVGATPGNQFFLGEKGNNYIRVSFCLHPEKVSQGLNALYNGYVIYKKFLSHKYF